MIARICASQKDLKLRGKNEHEVCFPGVAAANKKLPKAGSG
ncbi:hypothetical protein HOLDEFILI_01552 [Holdemania filiformis DSM 12042]|uniref:Uncharacterized protein n=1 Tax=Holdemania filiformis DSM 12042 TaxID=545696 RepID=B9Y6V9_9FIRM|nr:hypothetical protein HOLDEFILI_01552 [Holdemania filiformis DSM 12042]